MGQFDISSVMSLIKNPSMIYSSYKVKIFMKRYIICNNWQRKSFGTLNLFIQLIKFPLLFTKCFSCNSTQQPIFEISWSADTGWYFSQKLNTMSLVQLVFQNEKGCWGMVTHYLLLVKTILTLTLHSILFGDNYCK